MSPEEFYQLGSTNIMKKNCVRWALELFQTLYNIKFVFHPKPVYERGFMIQCIKTRKLRLMGFRKLAKGASRVRT